MKLLVLYLQGMEGNNLLRSTYNGIADEQLATHLTERTGLGGGSTCTCKHIIGQ